MNGVLDFRLPAWAALLWLLWSPAVGAAESRVDAIERQLRGQPQAALQALAPVLAEASGEDRVHALMLRGALQARVPDEDGAEASAVELEALAGSTPLAAPAAGLVRAGIFARHAPLGRADRALVAAMATLPAQTPAGVRLRYVAALAAVRQSLGKLDESVALYQQAVGLADRGGPMWRRAELRSSLAYSLFLAKQNERALAVNNEARQLAVESDDLDAQVAVANADAIFAGALGRETDELQASERALALARRSGSRRLIGLTTANLADFYLNRRQYATALELSRQALALAREMTDRTSESLAQFNSGLALIGLGRIDEGSAQVRQALLVEERAGSLPMLANMQGEYGHALERAGRLGAAWAAHGEHRRLSEELFQRQHQDAVLELQESMDAERRQRELAALEVENRFKEAQLLGRELQHRLWALGLLGGALLLAVGALLLQRMRQSSARLRSTNAELQNAGERDALTGLANRRHFQVVMQQTSATAFEGSLLLIDLDHFKRINDSHGHAAGDAVLVATAQRLRAALREQDLTVRWGGEEFLVVVRNLPPEQVEALAERLLAAIGHAPVVHGRSAVPVTASIGFATFPLLPAREAVSWGQALDVVDTALYLAKAHGRNRAYGVRALSTAAGGEGAEPAANLENAWREGRAELAHVNGPQPVESAP